MSSLNTVKDVISEPPKVEVKTVPIKKQEFFGANHNWNNTVTETTQEHVVEDNSGMIVEEDIQAEEKKRGYPWPLFIMVLLSGGMYIINKIRIKQLMRQENDSN